MLRKSMIALAALATAGPVHAQQDPTQNPNAFNREFTAQRFAVVGRSSTIGTFFSLKPDCAPMDWIELTITKPPENGEARLIDMNTIPNYTAPNPRTKCNDKSVKARSLQYIPAKAGPDEIEVEFIDSGGSRSVTKFIITVK
jgi:hypothetical protein